MEDQYRHLHMPHELAIEFMVAFSRAEYALKSAGYAIGNGKLVNPAWDEYANEIHSDFCNLEDKNITDKASYLLDEPPRKQVLNEQKVEFKDQIIDNNQKSTQQLLLMVRTVRNNLFHGGKFLPNGEHETGRNQRLVESSLAILCTCISLNERVSTIYNH